MHLLDERPRRSCCGYPIIPQIRKILGGAAAFPDALSTASGPHPIRFRPASSRWCSHGSRVPALRASLRSRMVTEPPESGNVQLSQPTRQPASDSSPPSSRRAPGGGHPKQLDRDVVCTRGPNFPLSRLEGRLMCPACGNRSVTVVFAPPKNSQVVGR